MKLRKTRILKVTKANDGVYFIPQYKWFFGLFWSDFDRGIEVSTGSLSTLAEWHWDSRYSFSIKLPSVRLAEEMIDAYIAYVNHQNASKIENKVVKTEIIKYP